ncbi:hypothetical protein ACQ86G_03025 [Roseateles chitinivorans]|uniref:hypothetical protein n=1 Tax=Roseateles chitinivorans TaxID=2917965 RepID=UPI003D66E302
MKISRSLPGVLIAAVLGLGLSAVATVSAVTAASAPPRPSRHHLPPIPRRHRCGH